MSLSEEKEVVDAVAAVEEAVADDAVVVVKEGVVQ